MSEPLARNDYFTRKEYLETEALAEYKSEDYNGEMFAMAGGTPEHSIICLNLNWCIREATDDKDCIGFESNMKLEIAEADVFVYPDLMVICGAVEFAENRKDAVTNPVLIIEVLSPGTESFDRGKKFEYYQMIKSLKEYVIVSQEEPVVETYFRQDKNQWLYTVAKGFDKTVLLNSIEYEIALKDIYHKVNWKEDV